MEIRHAEPGDHARVAAVIDDWWGGRRMRDMLPRLFFTHFRDTSFVAEDGTGGIAGFLCGFLSQTYADQAYVHFVGVAPAKRGAGLARALYERSSMLRGPPAAHRSTVSPRRSTPARSRSTKLGFVAEAEVEGYDGSDESRVLLRRAL